MNILRPLKPITSGPLAWFNKLISGYRNAYVYVVAVVGRKVSFIGLLFVLLIIANYAFLKILNFPDRKFF